MALVIHMPEENLEMCVAEVGRYVTFQIGKGNRKDVLDLTGYVGHVSFAYTSVPHVKRGAFVDQANGLLIYTFRGDELTTKGECFMQPVIQAPDWYGGGAPGRGGLRTSGDLCTIRVFSRPA